MNTLRVGERVVARVSNEGAVHAAWGGFCPLLLGRIEADGSVRTPQGAEAGAVSASGDVFDASGALVGHVDTQGVVTRAQGQPFGSARGSDPVRAGAALLLLFGGPESPTPVPDRGRLAVYVASGAIAALLIGSVAFRVVSRPSAPPARPADPPATTPLSRIEEPRFTPAGPADAPASAGDPVHAAMQPGSSPVRGSGIPDAGEEETAPAGPRWADERFPETRTGDLDEAVVRAWSHAQVRYALNEIYARHGYPFRTAAIRRQFEDFPWYRPVAGRTQPEVESLLSPAEKRNLLLLARWRDAMRQAGETE